MFASIYISRVEDTLRRLLHSPITAHSVDSSSVIGNLEVVQYWFNVGSMLGHRLRRWPNIEPALVHSVNSSSEEENTLAEVLSGEDE